MALSGLTNALIDVIFDVSEEESVELVNLKKSNPEEFFKRIKHKEKTFCPAGSPANTIFNAASLGINTSLLGTIGNDELGEIYEQALAHYSINNLLDKQNGKSGVCYVLLPPNRDRIVLADVGVSGLFADYKNLDAEVLHTSAYELRTNPPKASQIIQDSKRQNMKVSFDLASTSMIRRCRQDIEGILKNIDILFMTEEEAVAFTQRSPEHALEMLADEVEIAILKKGSKGSIVRKSGRSYNIPVNEVKVESTCGAGDAYAAGFLSAYLQGKTAEECGHYASFVAGKVCAIKGSHL